jgi:hypothetical protein
METIPPKHRTALFEDAVTVWKEGILKSRSSFKIDPSAYLKLFQVNISKELKPNSSFPIYFWE